MHYSEDIYGIYLTQYLTLYYIINTHILTLQVAMCLDSLTVLFLSNVRQFY